MAKTVERTPRTAKAHIYLVNINGENHLVRAMSRSKAIKFVTTPVEAKIASQDEIVDLMGNDIRVESAL